MVLSSKTTLNEQLITLTQSSVNYFYFLSIFRYVHNLLFFSLFCTTLNILNGLDLNILNIISYYIKNHSYIDTIIYITKCVRFLLFMWSTNFLLLLWLTVILDIILIKIHIPPQWGTIISLIIITFNLHTWFQNQIFFIFGIFNSSKELQQCIHNNSKINELNFLINNKQNFLRKLLFDQVQKCRKYFYRNMFNQANYHSEFFYGNSYYLSQLTKPNNVSYISVSFSQFLEIILPRSIFLLLNFHGVKTLFLRVTLYTLAFFGKFIYQINLMMLTLS